jgi:hypothetical protein
LSSNKNKGGGNVNIKGPTYSLNIDLNLGF